MGEIILDFSYVKFLPKLKRPQQMPILHLEHLLRYKLFMPSTFNNALTGFSLNALGKVLASRLATMVHPGNMSRLMPTLMKELEERK